MKRYSHLTIIGIFCIMALATKLQAQNHVVALNMGLATVRGETTDQKIMQEDYGLNIGIKYLMPLKNECFALTFDASIATINLSRDFSNSQVESYYTNQFKQSYIGLGLRFYMSKKVNEYNPYSGMILPFIGISAGATNTVRNISIQDNLPTLAGKTPVSDPTSGYEFTDGSNFDLSGQLEGGLVYVINEAWSVEGSATARQGFSDTWDGIQGNGNSDDWFTSIGLGVQFRF